MSTRAGPGERAPPAPLLPTLKPQGGAGVTGRLLNLCIGDGNAAGPGALGTASLCQTWSQPTALWVGTCDPCALLALTSTGPTVAKCPSVQCRQSSGISSKEAVADAGGRGGPERCPSPDPQLPLRPEPAKSRCFLGPRLKAPGPSGCEAAGASEEHKNVWITLFHLYYIQRALISRLSRGPLRWPLWGRTLVYLEEECLRRMEPPVPIHHRLPLAGPGRGRVWGGRGPAGQPQPDTRGSRPAGSTGGPGPPPKGRVGQHEWALGLCPLCLEGAGPGKLGCSLGAAWRPVGDV